MKRRRVSLVVEVDLDMFPGDMHTPESARACVLQDLLYTMHHYNPTVKIIEKEEENNGCS